MLGLMTLKRCELAVKEGGNVDERRDLSRRNAKFLRRYSPEAPFAPGFGKLRKDIRVEALRNGRIEERGNTMRSQVFIQMLWKDVWVAGYCAALGAELADCNMIRMAIEAIRTEGNDRSWTQFTNRAHNFFKRFLFRFCANNRGYPAVFQIEKAQPIHAQDFTGGAQFALAHGA